MHAIVGAGGEPRGCGAPFRPNCRRRDAPIEKTAAAFLPSDPPPSPELPRPALRRVALSASRSITPHLLDVVAPCTPSGENVRRDRCRRTPRRFSARCKPVTWTAPSAKWKAPPPARARGRPHRHGHPDRACWCVPSPGTWGPRSESLRTIKGAFDERGDDGANSSCGRSGRIGDRRVTAHAPTLQVRFCRRRMSEVLAPTTRQQHQVAEHRSKGSSNAVKVSSQC